MKSELACGVTEVSHCSRSVRHAQCPASKVRVLHGSPTKLDVHRISVSTSAGVVQSLSPRSEQPSTTTCEAVPGEHHCHRSIVSPDGLRKMWIVVWNRLVLHLGFKGSETI
jgi:hypothetical protein